MELAKQVDNWMLVSDLDGTLLGNRDATRRFRDWWSQSGRGGKLVYASGRGYDSIVGSIQDQSLPTPDAIIGDVGTDVRLTTTGLPLIDWTRRWWSSWEIEGVRRVLDGRPELTLQPGYCQTAYKRSYFVHDLPTGWLPRTRFELSQQNVRAELVYSSNRDLDVLPAGVNKGAAAEFLAQLWHIPRRRVLVAGDSGNDLSMFLRGYSGIVVGNAQPELASVAGPTIYRSSSEFADGVIEGVRHWRSTRGEKIELG